MCPRVWGLFFKELPQLKQHSQQLGVDYKWGLKGRSQQETKSGKIWVKEMLSGPVWPGLALALASGFTAG